MKCRSILFICICLVQVSFANKDSTFSVLDHRLDILLPRDFTMELERQKIMGPKPSERDYVEFLKKQDGEMFSISFRETYAKSERGFKKEIKEHLKTWKSMGTEFSLKEKLEKNDLTFYTIEPEEYLTKDPMFIYQAFFIELDDHSIVSCAILMNKSALTNLESYTPLIHSISDRIRLGQRKTILKGSNISHWSGNDSISFVMPFDGLIVPKKGFDYEIVKLTELRSLNSFSSEMIVYFGHHPQKILNDLPESLKLRVQVKESLAFGEKIVWEYLYPTRDENFGFMQEGRLPVGKAFYHIYISSPTEKGLKELERMVGNMTKF